MKRKNCNKKLSKEIQSQKFFRLSFFSLNSARTPAERQIQILIKTNKQISSDIFANVYEVEHHNGSTIHVPLVESE